MSTPHWNPALHDAAKRHAAALRKEALDTAFSALGQALRRVLAPRQQPEA